MSMVIYRLYHGTDKIFEIPDFSKADAEGFSNKCIYLGDYETACIWGDIINVYDLKIYTTKYKFKDCVGYSKDTYKMLTNLYRGHDYDIVKVPIALRQPFCDFVFDVITSDSDECIDRALECHKTERYDNEFAGYYGLSPDKNILVEDDNFEVVIFNPRVLEDLTFIKRIILY